MTFFHTAAANEVLFRGLMEEMAPGVEARHVVRGDLLERAAALGAVDAALARETVAAMEEAAAGTDLLLCTCSTIGKCADAVVVAGCEVRRIDRPMAYLAAAEGERILVAACLESTVGPTQDLVEEATGGRTRGEVLLLPEAWGYWQRGDKRGYWGAIAEGLRGRAGEFDAILLAQASMAGAAELLGDLPVKVLASPRTGLAAALESVVGGGGADGVVHGA